jgi:L-alanine-DL-glutamate epimerase-like enolase superfamily enzyme
MKIVGWHTRLLKAASLYPFQIVLEVEGVDGASGLGYVRGANIGIARAMLALTEHLASEMTGTDWAGPGEMWSRMRQLCTSIGPDGISNAAIAAVDTAAWDLFARGLGLPLYRVLGGYRDHIRAYASFGINRETRTEEIGKVAQSIKSEGFTALKMRVAGGRTPEEDAERVRLVRQAVGPDFDILIDVNFLWSATESVRFGKALVNNDLYWLEDVAPKHDVEGFRHVRESLHIPISSCERLEYPEQFRRMLEERAIDVAMIDVGKVGGITPWLQIAHLCQAFNVPVSGHAFAELTPTLMCAVPNALILEYFRPQPLFEDTSRLEQGVVYPSDKPGLGLTLAKDFESHAQVVSTSAS